jgi:iron complex transport system ATP-binding protein
MDKSPALEIQAMSVGYRQTGRTPRVVARNVTVSLRAGQFVCLLGPNGAGKSTLIRTISGVQQPLSGKVLLDGKPLDHYSAQDLARRMSLVLTQRVAVGVMPAITLVSMGRHPFTDWTGRLRAQDEEAVRSAMVSVGIEDLAQRPVLELSDGERQKVMIARALAQDPQIMILDEATAFLDLPHRVELMHLLRRLAPAEGRAILLATHDLDLALRCADRLWLLGPNGAFRQGTPEDLVLTDVLEAAFPHAGVQFDKASGAFAQNGSHRGSIALIGEGLGAIWTCRALERAGYRVVGPEGAGVCVEVWHGKRELSWKIKNDETIWCNSVESLLEHLSHCHGLLQREAP